MPSIVIVEKNGELKAQEYKCENADDLYKKCSFKKADGFGKVAEWTYSKKNESMITVELWARSDGQANQENKYDFPPPVDSELFFGNCALLARDSAMKIVDLTVDKWNKVYEHLFGGFESLIDNEEEDDEEESLEEAAEEDDEEETVEEAKEEKMEESKFRTKSVAELMREYVEKVSTPENTEGKGVGNAGKVATINAKPTVAGKNDMGGTTKNIARGSSDTNPDGKSAPSAEKPKDLIGKVQNTAGGSKKLEPAKKPTLSQASGVNKTAIIDGK